jgi:hypothetical protein
MAPDSREFSSDADSQQPTAAPKKARFGEFGSSTRDSTDGRTRTSNTSGLLDGSPARKPRFGALGSATNDSLERSTNATTQPESNGMTFHETIDASGNVTGRTVTFAASVMMPELQLHGTFSVNLNGFEISVSQSPGKILQP